MKTLMLLFFAMLILALQSVSALAATYVYLEPNISSVTEGDNYTTTIMIDTDQDVFAYELIVKYNPDILNFVDIQEGDFLSELFTPNFYEFHDEENGIIEIGGLNFPLEGETGAGTFAIIYFHANSDGSPGLSIQNISLVDETGTDEIHIGDESLEEPEPPSPPPSGGSSSGGSGGGFFPPVCTSRWNCTEWSTCSGGIQTKTCEDLNNCEDDYNEDQPCGGSLYHGGYPGAEGYTTQTSSGACNDGTRVCGSEGVVECKSGRLVKIESCEFGCERGVCLNEQGQPGLLTGDFILDPAIGLYTVFIGVIVIFGIAIVFYGMK